MFRLLLVAAIVLIAASAHAAERTATGTFEVSMTEATATQMNMAKTYSGALTGKGTGPFVGDARVTAYVALETFNGALDGRKGSFILMHRGWQGADKVNHLDILIAPNSGTDQLAGISGSLAIQIDTIGKHYYTLRYHLPLM